MKKDMNEIVKTLTISAMLATVAWFFWNPVGWVFQWEPVVVFLLSLSGFVATELQGARNLRLHSAHPNDIELFKSFLDVLPNATFIEFLKQHDFLIEFKLSDIKPLSRFLLGWDNAAHEFQDESLELLRKELLDSAKKLDQAISKYTSPNSSGWQAVRVDSHKGNSEHEERFRREAAIIDDASDKFIELHQKLVRKGRQLCPLSEKSI